MAIEARHGVRSTWFFLEESMPFQPFRPRAWKLSLGRYSVKEKQLGEILRDLVSGGWELGLHGSYRSYRDPALLTNEKALLEKACGRTVRGIRQHYLNLDVPETWRLQKDAGFEYDASFGYRRGLGWRNGRTRAFCDRESGMWVLPLAIMEANLFREANGVPERAWSIAKELIDEAEARRAVLTVLWHPHVFSDADFPGYSWVYERIIEEGRRRGAYFATAEEAVRECRHAEYLPAANLTAGK